MNNFLSMRRRRWKKNSVKANAPMSVRRSLVFSFARNYTNMALTVPTIMIVSRLLTPAQIGVYSVAMAAVTLVHTLRDFGVSDYIVQAKDLDERSAQSAFLINIIIAWVLGISMIAIAGLAATFYREPGLKEVLWILSINFFLLPFASTVYAMLKRSMQFGIVYKINLAQQATASGSTVLFAYLGYGYFAPAWGAVAGTVANIIASNTLGSAYRIRGFSLYEWREVTNFGIQRTSADIVTRISASVPDFVIGRVIDFAAVGLYSRGAGLINMFRKNVLGAIGPVTFTSYARLHRNTDNAHVLFSKALFFITGISWPFMVFAMLLAFPIMRIAFGDQWDAAIPLLRLFCVAGIISATTSECSRYFIAVGRVNLVTKISFGMLFFRLLLIIPAAYVSLWAVILVQVLGALTSSIVYYRLMFKKTNLTISELLAPLSKSAIVTCIAMILPCLVVWCTPPSPNNLWLPLGAAAAGAFIGWLAGLRATNHPIWSEVESWAANFRLRVTSANR